MAEDSREMRPVNRTLIVVAVGLGLGTPALAFGAPSGGSANPWSAPSEAQPYAPTFRLTCTREGPEGAVIKNAGQGDVPAQTFVTFELAKTDSFGAYTGGYEFTTPLAPGASVAVNTPRVDTGGQHDPTGDPSSTAYGASLGFHLLGPCQVISAKRASPRVGALPPPGPVPSAH